MPRTSALPDLTITLSCTQGLYDLMNGTRLWNQYARAALQAELIKHHVLRIPRHFRVGARAVYGYMARKKSTELAKMRVFRLPPNLDLVKSKQMSLSVMRTRQITFAGNFGSAAGPGTLQGRLNMLIGHPLKRGKWSGGVTPEQIKLEIIRTTPAEALEIAEGYRNRLVYQIRQQHGPMRQIRKSPGKYGLVSNPKFFTR